MFMQKTYYHYLCASCVSCDFQLFPLMYSVKAESDFITAVSVSLPLLIHNFFIEWYCCLLTFNIVALKRTLSLSYQADVSATVKDELLPSQHKAVIDQTTFWACKLHGCLWSCYTGVQSPSSILNDANDPISSQQSQKCKWEAESMLKIFQW